MNIKYPLLTALYASAIGAFVLSTASAAQAELSAAAADAVIRAAHDERKREHAKRRQALEAVPALAEFEVTRPGYTVTFRRISPPIPVPAATRQTTAGAHNSAQNIAELEQNHPPHHMIGLGAIVYEDGISEITWRDDDGLAYTVLSNINFNLLRNVGDFTDDGEWYAFHASIESTAGASPDAALFTGSFIEYIILAPEKAIIPAALYQQFDALHRHYLANREGLATAHQRREALDAARRRHAESRPPEPKPDRTINFWRIEAE